MAGTFVYKREVNKSVLWDGFGIERPYVGIFLEQTGRLDRGEKKTIRILFQNKWYKAEIKNLNNPVEKRTNDAFQIRYTANGEFAKALQQVFCKTYQYIQSNQAVGIKDNERKRFFTDIPKEYKEYIALFTTDKPNDFLCEPIVCDDIEALRKTAKSQTEWQYEGEINYALHDGTAGYTTHTSEVKLRKMDRSIGDALKKHYQYRCQICGKLIGESYGSIMIEAHHIDYFVKSLNNDFSNIMVVCPNHHGVIHDTNPTFDRKTCFYTYPNGYKEGLVINDHL